MKIRGGESGQATIFVVLSMTVLLGFVGFAADVGVLLHTKRNLQTAADSAAIAGAAELGYTDLTTAAAGQAAATQNGFANGVNGAVVAINNPPLYGVHAGNAAFVEAVISQNQPTIFAATFAALFHGTSLSTMEVVARAVATNGIGQGCIYTLGTSGTDISVTTSGSQPTLNAPLCGIFDDSSSGTALNVVSSGNPTPITAKSIGIVGGYSETGGTVSPTPVTGIVPESDPLAYLPAPAASHGSCLANPNIVISSGTATIPAGNYCSGISVIASGATVDFGSGGFTVSGGLTITGSAITVNFATGTYDIGGGFNITGSSDTLNGSGVTFYMNSGALNLTASSTTLNLTAPTSGTYDSILFDQSPSDTSGATITESGSTSVLEGALYFPDAPLTFTASGSSTNIYLDFVVQSLNVTTSSTTINDYAALYGTSAIKATTLVE